MRLYFPKFKGQINNLPSTASAISLQLLTFNTFLYKRVAPAIVSLFSFFKQCINPVFQLFDVEGLCEIVVGSRPDCYDSAIFIIQRGDDDDRRASKIGIRP